MDMVKVEEVTRSKGVKSILAAIDFLKNKGYKEIAIVAESFGGQCAILSAAQLDLTFLVLKSPVSDYVEVEKRRRSKENLCNWKKTDLLQFTNGF